MFWLSIAAIIVGALLFNKGKKDHSSLLKTIGLITLIIGIIVLLIALAVILFALGLIGVGIANIPL